jgi:hypothetical protein
MNRSTEKLDDSHDRMIFKMQGTEERDNWMRTFPEPLPATHELVHEWTDAMTLHVYVRPRKAKRASTAAVGTDAGTGGAAADADPAGESKDADAQGPAQDQLVSDVSELTRLSIADLRTRAAELEVEGVRPNATKAHLVALISARLAQIQSEATDTPAAA